jgi:hypothetical protein
VSVGGGSDVESDMGAGYTGEKSGGGESGEVGFGGLCGRAMGCGELG